MTLKLITTGGTIATVADARSGRTRPALQSGEIARLIEERADGDMEVEQLALSPSWALSAAEMLTVATAARDAARTGRFAGVVVTHGTSTLEYTAFLAELMNDTEVPIVFTGAMRIATDPDPDGPRNLADAAAVASDPRSRNYRALVVFAGLVINARNAWKLKRDQVDAFISVNEQPGEVSGAEVRMPPLPPPHTVFTGPMEENVSLVKVYPGITAQIFAAATWAGVRGAVVEAFAGAGGIPRHLHTELAEAAVRVPVVISSRAPVGLVATPPTGGTGEPLSRMDLLSAHDLSSEKAWLLLMMALGQGANAGEARALFEAYTSMSGAGRVAETP
jgi:L-asparaginase